MPQQKILHNAMIIPQATTKTQHNQINIFFNKKLVFVPANTLSTCMPTVIKSYLFATPWTVGQPAPLSVGFSRQEYWSGLPLPPPGGLPDPGIKPTSPALIGGFFITEQPER